jgi:site-specific DNA-adenine methylase
VGHRRPRRPQYIEAPFADLEENRGLRRPLRFSRPPFAWPGNKATAYSRPQFQWLRAHLKSCQTWCEPFAGGAGTLWWALRLGARPKRIFMAENCAPTARFWRVLAKGRIGPSLRRAQSQLEKAAVYVRRHDFDAAEAFYNDVREEYNHGRHRLSDFLFLVRASFNGLVRFNSRGEFNAPNGFGKQAARVDGTGSKSALKSLDTEAIESLAEMVRTGTRLVVDDDWRLALARLKPSMASGAIVIVDPPYLPDDGVALAYGPEPFLAADHRRLARALGKANKGGFRWILHGYGNRRTQRAYHKLKPVADVHVVEGVKHRIVGGTPDADGSEMVWQSKNWSNNR